MPIAILPEEDRYPIKSPKLIQAALPEGHDRRNLPAAEVIAWCSAMHENDRVGFIAREPLESLRQRSQRPAT